MPRLVERQRDFATGLLDPTHPLPQGIIAPDGSQSVRRFSVYRNNVVVGLTDALRDAFPAVLRLVGEAFFRAMAHEYVRESPPRSSLLLAYGVDFARFIETFEPAATVPYLADVARIEWAWREAYYAEDAPSLEMTDFREIPVNEFPYQHLTLHPSLRIVRSTMPALTIWEMNTEKCNFRETALENQAQDALILRPDAIVEVRLMPPGSAEFLGALAGGYPVIDAAAHASASDPRFDLSTNIGELIAFGAFVGCDPADQASAT